MSYIPEDRQEDGIVERFSLADNLVLDLYNRPPYASGLVLHLDAIRESATKHMEEYDIRATSIDMTVGTLSGGNQQKVIVARELGRDVTPSRRQPADPWARRRFDRVRPQPDRLRPATMAPPC